jgi:hypothetical protein
MPKMTGKISLISGIIILSIIAPLSAYASCDAYIKENESISGVVPKFDKNGKVRAFVIGAEATFLVPKRSLIGKARRKAELRAKRAFAEFMKTKFKSDSVVADMLNQVEKTDAAGNTEGMAEELSTQVDSMRANTSAVLSGIVKLDECVDKKEKVVMVQVGWKPSLSKAAADAVITTNKEVQRGDKAVAERKRAERRNKQNGVAKKKSSSSKSAQPSPNLGERTKITPSSGYRKKSTLKDKF